MEDVLLKCIDTGCTPADCMGENTAAMQDLLTMPSPGAGCNKVYYASLVQQCRADEVECTSRIGLAHGDIDALKEAFCSPGVCAAFGDCVRLALLDSQCDSDELATGYSTFHSTQTAVCTDQVEPPPCANGCKDLFIADLSNDGLLAADGALSTLQTCDYYRDYVFGSKCGGALKTFEANTFLPGTGAAEDNASPAVDANDASTSATSTSTSTSTAAAQGDGQVVAGDGQDDVATEATSTSTSTSTAAAPGDGQVDAGDGNIDSST
jgi:hypothetical protein